MQQCALCGGYQQINRCIWGISCKCLQSGETLIRPMKVDMGVPPRNYPYPVFCSINCYHHYKLIIHKTTTIRPVPREIESNFHCDFNSSSSPSASLRPFIPNNVKQRSKI